MDRFEWCEFTLSSWESHVTHQAGVALYDGNDKVISFCDLCSKHGFLPSKVAL